MLQPWTLYRVNHTGSLTQIAKAESPAHLNRALSDVDWEAKHHNTAWDYVDSSDIPVNPSEWPGLAVEAELRICGRIAYIAKVDK